MNIISIMKKVLTQEDKLQIIELYKSGLGSNIIGNKMNIHPNTVLKLLKIHNIERRILRKKISYEDEIEINNLYKQNMSTLDISKKFNISRSMVSRYVKNINKKHYRKYAINEDFFDVIDSEEKAYFLGFLYADGGNIKKQNFIRIDLAEKDIDILQKLSKLIYIENSEYHIKLQNRKKIYKDKEVIYNSAYLNINSKHICEQLEFLGCTPKKSLILTFPKSFINNELQRHFIRGYYDGDGGIYLTNIKNRCATAKITSTIEFCKSITGIILSNTNVKFGNPYNNIKNKNVHSISISGNRQIATFLNWLYKDSTIHLNRKYNLYLNLLNKNIETDKLIIANTIGYAKRYLPK